MGFCVLNRAVVASEGDGGIAGFTRDCDSAARSIMLVADYANSAVGILFCRFSYQSHNQERLLSVALPDSGRA